MAGSTAVGVIVFPVASPVSCSITGGSITGSVLVEGSGGGCSGGDCSDGPVSSSSGPLVCSGTGMPLLIWLLVT